MSTRTTATLLAVTPLLAGAGAAALSAAASAHVLARAASAPTVSVESSSLGPVLVDSIQRTLYAFTKDKKNVSECTGACAKVWPPLMSAKPIAGKGAKQSLLGTIKRGSSYQVTYAGHPLYGYAAGGGFGTGYVGTPQFGGTWDAVTATGALKK